MISTGSVNSKTVRVFIGPLYLSALRSALADGAMNGVSVAESDKKMTLHSLIMRSMAQRLFMNRASWQVFVAFC
jgi:hypothetical protein